MEIQALFKDFAGDIEVPGCQAHEHTLNLLGTWSLKPLGKTKTRVGKLFQRKKKIKVTGLLGRLIFAWRQEV